MKAAFSMYIQFNFGLIKCIYRITKCSLDLVVLNNCKAMYTEKGFKHYHDYSYMENKLPLICNLQWSRHRSSSLICYKLNFIFYHECQCYFKHVTLTKAIMSMLHVSYNSKNIQWKYKLQMVIHQKYLLMAFVQCTHI